MSADQPPPQVRVTLPDRQEVRGLLRQRKQWPGVGWMYHVGLPAWENSEDEGVVAREYRVWLAPGVHVHPIDGVSYDQVPTVPLPPAETDEPDRSRWGWKVQRSRPGKGLPPVVVHVWDCPDAPAGNPELDVYEALDVMRTTAGAELCKECGAAVALGPLLEPS